MDKAASLELHALSIISAALPTVRGASAVVDRIGRFYARRRRLGADARVYGWNMRLLPEELVDRRLMLAPQVFDPAERRFLALRLEPGSTFLDAGAYIGAYTAAASRVVGPTGRVIAVEANPATYRRLAEHVERNGATNVTPIEVGLSDRRERLRLGVRPSGNRAGSSFLNEEGEGVFVECFPLLDLLRQQGVDRLDAAKLDIEGFEYRVLASFLRSAPNALLPRAIVVEYHETWQAVRDQDPVNLLLRHGYRMEFRHGTNFALSRGEA